MVDPGGLHGQDPGRPRPGRPLPPLPGLDGLRGVAVLAVLAYHSGAGWARGGWLGVSAFFTLSGYLITTLLLAEVGDRGGVSLGGFAGRRVRRLLPALVMAVAGVVVLGRWWALPSSLAHLRGDAWATLGQVANWQFLARGQGYGAQFDATSPLLHTWSLSIEAQAYVILPLVVVVASWLATRWARPPVTGHDRAVTAVSVALGALCLGSVAVGAVLTESGATVDRLYFGTDVRLAELLAGSLLAVGLLRRPLERTSAELRQALDAAGLLALAAGLAAWVVVDQAGRGFYPIGLWVHAAGAAVVIAAVRSGGVTARVLSCEPLQVVGRMSYGIYLYHWPVFTWLTPERTGWPDPAVHVLRWSITAGLAFLSFRFIEEPVRRRRGLMRAPRRWLAPVALAGAVALAFTIDPPPPDDRLDFAVAATELDQLAVAAAETTPRPGASAGADPGPSAEDLPPPRIAFVGDSTALVNAVGTGRWAERTGEVVFAPGLTETGCGLLPGPDHRMTVAPFTHGAVCPTWTDAVEPPNEQVDVVVLCFGAWDMAEHRIPGHGWGHLGDPPVDEAFRHEIEALTDTIAAAGMVPVWLLPPTMVFGTLDGVPPPREEPASDPARLDRFRALIGEVVAARPGRAATIDLREFLATQPGGELDPSLRPDLVHLTPAAAEALGAWLGPRLVELARERAPTMRPWPRHPS